MDGRQEKNTFNPLKCRAALVLKQHSCTSCVVMAAAKQQGLGSLWNAGQSAPTPPRPPGHLLAGGFSAASLQGFFVFNLLGKKLSSLCMLHTSKLLIVLYNCFPFSTSYQALFIVIQTMIDFHVSVLC